MGRPPPPHAHARGGRYLGAVHPRLPPGTVYKYEILGPQGLLPLKADPMALQVEAPPRTASIVADPAPPSFHDTAWLEARAASGGLVHGPLSIYEVHVGSWRRGLDWDQLGDELIPYVIQLGFTHVELLPIRVIPSAAPGDTRCSANMRQPRSTALRPSSRASWIAVMRPEWG